MISKVPDNESPDPTYYLVQYVPDPLRREASNVGVILQHGNSVVARFYAEDPEQIGTILRTKAKSRVLHPRIYEQWVQYWRDELARGNAGLNAVLDAEKINFQVTLGGTVGNIGADGVDKIASELFMDLVDSRKDKRPAKSTLTNKNLENEIRHEFVKLKLTRKDLLVSHPVVFGESIAGELTTHIPSCVQHNGRPYVMNALGLSPSNSRRRTAEKTGLTWSMFQDIRRKHKSAFTIAIVQYATEDKDEIERTEHILEVVSDQVVHWNVEAERLKFLEEREEIARSK